MIYHYHYNILQASETDGPFTRVYFYVPVVSGISFLKGAQNLPELCSESPDAVCQVAALGALAVLGQDVSDLPGGSQPETAKNTLSI